MTDETKALVIAQLVQSSGKHASNISKVDVQNAGNVVEMIEAEIESRKLLAKSKVSQTPKVQSYVSPEGLLRTVPSDMGR